MDKETLLIEIYCKISALLKQDKFVNVLKRPGVKPRFTDVELITLSVFQEFTSFYKEDDYWQYCKVHLIKDFPELCDRTQYNRRRKNLVNIINMIRCELLKELPSNSKTLIFDTLPVPVCTYTKGSKTKRFDGADFGYCSSKNMKYFGYKTALAVTDNGIPVDFEFGSAAPHDIEYAKSMLYQYQGINVIADKALSGYKFKDNLINERDIQIISPDKSNARYKNPPWHKILIRKVRNRIETVIGQLANLFSFERTWAKSQIGTFTRLVNKLLAFTFGLYINYKYNFDFNKLDHLMNLF
jgi:hypothetical protein